MKGIVDKCSDRTCTKKYALTEGPKPGGWRVNVGHPLCPPPPSSHYGVLAMMAEPAIKTSLESKHLRNYDYFAIIPSFSHFTMLTKNPATGLI